MEQVRARKDRRNTLRRPTAPERHGSIRETADRVRVAVIVAAGFLAYANAFHGPFLFDDVVSIRDNGAIREWWNLKAIFEPQVGMPLAGRPFAIFSLAINYALGGLAVEGYHFVNVALHVSCALLLYAIARRSFEGPRLRDAFGTQAANLAFAIALVWTVHPLNSEVVDYTLQRTESLMALCLLATLYGAIRALDAHHTRWQAFAVACCLLGMMAKESMVVAPVLIMLYDGTIGLESWRAAWRDRWRFYAALVATWAVLGFLLWSDQRVNPARALASSGAAPVTVWMYLLNQAPLIVRYVRLAIWPTSLVALYGAPAGLTLSDVWPSALVVLIVLAATIVLLVRKPALGFPGAWVLVTLAPTSSVMPLTTEVGAERRMYLPMMAIATLAVLGAYALGRRATGARLGATSARARSAFAWGALIATVFLLGTATVARTSEYQSGLLLARTSVERWPTGEGHYQLGSELQAVGRRDEAEQEFRLAASTFPRARFYLGQALFGDRRLDEAAAELRTFIQEEPWAAEVIRAHLLLGGVAQLQARWTDAVAESQQVLAMTPGNVDARFLLADALSAMDRFEEAVPHYQAYVAVRPNDLLALTNLGVALAMTDRNDEAIPVFRRAIEVDPRNSRLRSNLARALLARSDLAEAGAQAREAVALEPNTAANHDLLGQVLAAEGRFDEAKAAFGRALALDPTADQTREDLARLTGPAPRKSGR